MICIADKNTIPYPSAEGVDCLLLDTDADVQYLSAEPPMGCVAFIIETGEFYVSTGDYKWIHFNNKKEKVDLLTIANTLDTLCAFGGTVQVKNMSIPASASKNKVLAIVDKDSNINFGDNVITLEQGFGSGDSVNVAAFYVSGCDVELNGENGGIRAKDLGTNDGPHCVIIESGADVTVNGGVYRGGATAFYVSKGTLTINGGTFGSWDKHTYSADEAHLWTLNCKDEAYKNGEAKIIVRGGTFIDFDPSNPKTNDADSYVDNGYKVEQKTVNGHIYYTVLKN